MIIDNIPLPRLLNASLGTERVIHPVTVSINLNLTPLSDATMTLPRDETLPARGYVELFTCMGSAGIFRVRSPQDAYGTPTTTAELEHAIVEVGDYLILNKYDEMMAASTAMTTVFSHYRGSAWQLGSVSALGSGEISLEADHVRVLEAMLSILEQKPECMMAFDFTTHPWTVSIVAKDTIATAEGRLSRNVNNAKVIYDDTELCTRVYYERLKSSSGSNTKKETEWRYLDADTMSTYGLVERTVSTGSDLEQDEADSVAALYLREHKQPRTSIEISAQELSCITGEPFDAFTPGKLFRLVLVDYNQLPVEKNITALSFSDVYGKPMEISVMLDQEEDTLINFLHDVDSSGGSGGGGQASQQKDTQTKKYYTEWINTETQIGMVIGEVDGAYKIRGGQITLAINEDGGTTAKIDADCVDISGVVVKINASEDLIISAAHIDIDGIVDELTAYDIEVGTVEAMDGTSSFHDIYVETQVDCSDGKGMFDSVETNGIVMGSESTAATWQSTAIKHITSVSTGHYFLYAADSQTHTPTGSVNGYIVTGTTTTTLHYLGKAPT